MQKKYSLILALFAVVLFPIQILSAKPSQPAVSSLSTVPPATPAATMTPAPPDAQPSGPPLSLTLTLLFTCCSVGLVLGVLILGILAGRTNAKAVADEKKGFTAGKGAK